MGIVRLATELEKQYILSFALRVLKESTFGHVKPSWDIAMQLTTQFLDNGGYYLVYSEDGMIKGWIGLGSTYDFLNDRPIGYLHELYVLPRYRRQGIARELCLEAIRQLRNGGFNKIQLNVYVGNKAKPFYEELGFRDVMTLMQLDVGKNGK